MENKIWDVVIIGGGPSGYTAAIYTARAMLSTLVISGTAAGGQLMNTTEVENFPGFSRGIMGPDLMIEMMEQAKRFGAILENENVTKVELEGEIKKIFVGEREILAKTVIVSTGAGSKMLNVGEEKLIGRGVSMCAVCDAAFFRGKNTFVVGGGDAAIEDAMALSKFASEVNLVVRREELRASKIMQERVKNNPKVKIVWNSEVTRVLGNDKLHSIELKNSKTQEIKSLSAEGLFLAIGHFPNTKLFEGQLELDEKGFLLTAMNGGLMLDNWIEGYPTQTTVDGVFGAGDVVDFKYKQAVTAAGMGCQAALDVEKYLTGTVSGY
ncbi:thioredoxin-disulfide reductase [Candidatus Collierbacteria bacterium RIFOXYD1_FULL_40_9]|uniref:Thioredoxin reductase n=1 Tax=Candidatus Collierbacteria bacterium RIFOXYD1_FULL_40_9 TaxID=1817731 RepID=A0A1F5FP84_9BACT|nr:MAG: thioredoxin-disulfide reductase [Candidatus Collierbacteria bacterium RIFOXYD1_FULL_40_9]